MTYKAFGDKVKYIDAVKSCRKKGGDIAMPKTHEEDRHISDAYKILGTDSAYWVGVHVSISSICYTLFYVYFPRILFTIKYVNVLNFPFIKASKKRIIRSRNTRSIFLEIFVFTLCFNHLIFDTALVRSYLSHILQITFSSSISFFLSFQF